MLKETEQPSLQQVLITHLSAVRSRYGEGDRIFREALKNGHHTWLYLDWMNARVLVEALAPAVVQGNMVVTLAIF